MEQIEDKPVESRAQTVTKAPDSSDHALDHTWAKRQGTGCQLETSGAEYISLFQSQFSSRSGGGDISAGQNSELVDDATINDVNLAKTVGPKLALLVWVGVTGHDGADGRKGDAGHCCHGSGSPHHPTTNDRHQLKVEEILRYWKLWSSLLGQD